MRLDLGNYYPVTSCWQGRDPRVKLALTVLGSLAALLLSGWELYGLALATVLLYWSARLPANLASGVLLQFKWLLLIAALANLIFPLNNRPLLMLLADKGPMALETSLRLGLFLVIAAWLGFVTKPLLLIAGLTRLLQPLARLKLPVADLGLAMGLTLHWLPELFNDWEEVQLAQRARGLAPSWRRFGFWVKSTVIPVFILSFRRAAAISRALAARGYQPGAPRSAPEELRFGRNDWLVGALLLLGLVGLVIRTW